jgi:tetratricopeptide (TPR) repeat protein
VPDTVSTVDDQRLAAGDGMAEQGVLIASIDAARAARDMALVVERAALLRQRFPHIRAGYRASADALRELGRLDEAATVLHDAQTRFEGQAWLLNAFATLAAQRGDWEEATARLAALRRNFPAMQDGYRLELGRLRLLGRFEDAASLLAAAETHCAGEEWLLFEAAMLAEARGDHHTATDIWRQYRAAAPNSRAGYVGGILAEAPPHVASDPVLIKQVARRTAPSDEAAQQAQLDVLTRTGRWDDAEALLDAACAAFPAARWALIGRANLAGARRTAAEIDEYWAQAVAAFPNDQEIALGYALAPTRGPKDTRDPSTALSRLQDVHRRFPDFAPAWRIYIKILRDAGSRQDAARIAEACVLRLPDDPDLRLELAASLGDDADIVTQLEMAATRFPNHDAIRIEWARALVRCGRFDSAEAAFQQALTRMPNYYDLACDHAELAMRRKDWPEALRRWQSIRARFPKDRRSEFGFLDTTTALRDAGLEAEISPHGASTRADEAVNLYSRFQSLGGTGLGCEFGLVQRANGAHPVCLLRWTNIHPRYLIDALNSRFAGVGTREQTVIGLSTAENPENPEYIYQDDRFKMAMHTFVHKRDMPEEDMFKQTCRRSTYLRRQLLEDLADGQQIFVYKFHERNLTLKELVGLHRAVRSYGNTTLLYVRYADADHPSGTVEQADAGLLVGYISGFNMSKKNVARPIDLPAWDMICRSALDLHLAAKAETRR